MGARLVQRFLRRWIRWLGLRMFTQLSGECAYLGVAHCLQRVGTVSGPPDAQALRRYGSSSKVIMVCE